MNTAANLTAILTAYRILLVWIHYFTAKPEKGQMRPSNTPPCYGVINELWLENFEDSL